ncbi:hypothetical protein Ae168Ps1_0913c [Pseudonocardia sp. Ae168_Ps1]|nr:hypothetical protein Ae168Ps1_0913c [Pseudonocardia sp. Ae168_Ps1]
MCGCLDTTNEPTPDRFVTATVNHPIRRQRVVGDPLSNTLRM